MKEILALLTDPQVIKVLLVLISAVQGIGLVRIVKFLKVTFDLNGRYTQLTAGAIAIIFATLTVWAGQGITDDPEVWNSIHIAAATIFGMSQVEYFSFWKKIKPPPPAERINS